MVNRHSFRKLKHR